MPAFQTDTQPLPTSLLLIPFCFPLSFSLILTSPSPYTCFHLTPRLLCTFPHAPCHPLRWLPRSQRVGQEEPSSRGLNFSSNFSDGDVGALNKIVIVFSRFFFSPPLPVFFFVPPPRQKYFPPAFSAANIVSRCNGAAAELGPKQNGGLSAAPLQSGAENDSMC